MSITTKVLWRFFMALLAALFIIEMVVGVVVLLIYDFKFLMDLQMVIVAAAFYIAAKVSHTYHRHLTGENKNDRH